VEASGLSSTWTYDGRLTYDSSWMKRSLVIEGYVSGLRRELEDLQYKRRARRGPDADGE
jgi:hypothetical protein